MTQSAVDAQKCIDGHTYVVRMLDPLTANDLLVDVSKVIGPALGAVGSSLLGSGDSKKALGELLDGLKEGETPADGSALGDGVERAIVGLVDRLEKHKLREVIGILANVTAVEMSKGSPELSSIFDVHFRGRIKAMYQWLAFALRVQYQDFF